MKTAVDSADMLRVCNRHKARTLSKLEEIGCPDGFLEIVRNGFGYLRSDLVEMCNAKPNRYPQHPQSKRRNKEQ